MDDESIRIFPSTPEEDYDHVADSFCSAGAGTPTSSISTISINETPPKDGPVTGVVAAFNGQTREPTTPFRLQNEDGNLTNSMEEGGGHSAEKNRAGFSSPSTSTQQHTSTHTNPPLLHNRNWKLTGSKSCDRLTYLSSPNPSHFPISPLTAYVEESWGDKSRNWVMWSVWDKDLMQQPFFNDCFEREGIPLNYRYVKNELQTEVNDVLTRLDDQFEHLEDENFLVVRVTQEDGYYPYSRTIELEVEGITFKATSLAPPPKQFFTKEEEDKLLRSDFYILACGGLAKILTAIVNKSDVVMITGGFKFFYDKKIFLALNYNKEECTRIVRVSACPEMEEGCMFLGERIQPISGDNRFKFKYVAEDAGKPRRRTVVLHRSIEAEDFCRNKNRSLTNKRSSYDFLVPIAKDADPKRIHNLLLSPEHGMPRERCPSSSPSPAVPVATLPRSSSRHQNFSRQEMDRSSMIREFHSSRENEGRWRSSEQPTPGNHRGRNRSLHRSGKSPSSDELMAEDDHYDRTAVSSPSQFSVADHWNFRRTQRFQNQPRSSSSRSNPSCKRIHLADLFTCKGLVGLLITLFVIAIIYCYWTWESKQLIWFNDKWTSFKNFVACVHGLMWQCGKCVHN